MYSKRLNSNIVFVSLFLGTILGLLLSPLFSFKQVIPIAPTLKQSFATASQNSSSDFLQIADSIALLSSKLHSIQASLDEFEILQEPVVAVQSVPEKSNDFDLVSGESTKCKEMRSSARNVCSFQHHLEYTTECDWKFPHIASWDGGSVLNPSECVLVNTAGSCLANARPRRIVLLGDSMAMRIFNGVNEVLGLQGITCVHLASESELAGSKPGAPYFGIPDIGSMDLQSRDCQGCGSRIHECRLDNGHSVIIEIVVSEFLMDWEMSEIQRYGHNPEYPACTNVDENVAVEGPVCRSRWNTQQVFFERYFNSFGTGYPDQIHIIGNIHDCSRRSSDDYKRDLTWVADMIDHAAPSSSKVYWWTSSMVRTDLQPIRWQKVTSPSCVRMMGDHIQSILAPYFARSRIAQAGDDRSKLSKQILDKAKTVIDHNGPMWMPTYNLLDLSEAVIGLNTDGVHYTSEYCRQIANLILNGYC
jgi:hypothetical protein